MRNDTFTVVIYTDLYYTILLNYKRCPERIWLWGTLHLSLWIWGTSYLEVRIITNSWILSLPELNSIRDSQRFRNSGSAHNPTLFLWTLTPSWKTQVQTPLRPASRPRPKSYNSILTFSLNMLPFELYDLLAYGLESAGRSSSTLSSFLEYLAPPGGFLWGKLIESPINSTNISGLNLGLGSSTLQHPQQIHPVLIAAFPAQMAHVHAVINPPPAATRCRACSIGASTLVRK